MRAPDNASPAAGPRRGCLRSILGCSTIVLIIIAIAFAGLYIWLQQRDVSLVALLIQSARGELSQDELIAQSNQAAGIGTISVLNLSDQVLWVDVISNTNTGGSTTAFVDLQPFDLQSMAKLAGPYEHRFYLDRDHFASPPPALATCAIELTRDQQYRFYVFGDRVLLQLDSNTSGDAVDVTRSPHCQKGVTP